MTLRDLLTDVEKKARDLADDLGINLLSRVEDLHDLSRPLRRKSHYPTMLALHNAVEKVLTAHQETDQALETLTAELDEIREHARRERLNRP
jgi:hypothetical protein